MNAENFAEYLKNPALLYQLSYEELKTLALQYPYSQNIQYLLLIKSKLDNHKDYSKNLARAAASMTDRTFLYRKIKELKLAAVEEGELISNEETLELRELSTLEEDIREKIPINLEEEDIPAKEQGLNMEFPPPAPSIDDDEDDDIDFHLLQTEVGEAAGDPTPKEQEAATGYRIGKEEMATLVALAATLDNWQVPGKVVVEPKKEPAVNWEEVVEASIETPVEPEPASAPFWEDALDTVEGISEILEFVLPRYFAHIPAPAPLPKAVFRSWKRKTIQRPIIPTEVTSGATKKPEEMAPAKSKKKAKSTDKKKKKIKVREIAAASVEEHESIVSETLAKLLESQGQYDKAIAMYERLIVADPEKSDYFRDIINKIKNA